MEPYMKEFIALCKEHGFSRKGKVFSRCIGDAVYQNITLTDTAYINPFSEAYTTTHRKSPYISIGFWSMYSDLHPDYLTDRRHIGSFTPENIMGVKFLTKNFMGFADEYEIMCSCGFDLLDGMLTQRALLDTFFELYRSEFDSRPINEVLLAEPFLYCGEREEAIIQLNGIYAQNWDSFHAKYDYLKAEKRYEEYLQIETEYEEKLRNVDMLTALALGKRHEEIQAYLTANLRRNEKLAKENGIAFASNYKPLI